MILTRDVFGERPKFAVLIDPDYEQDARLDELLEYLAKGYADIILVGGSTSSCNNIDRVIRKVKSICNQSVLLFPGNSFQLSDQADALLLPSLISGRNPDYLIGKHVESASIIYDSGIPVFAMGYILIDGGKKSTTSYVTQTQPIPDHQHQLAAQTALAGQLLGMKCIYLESGSGAKNPAKPGMIEYVKKSLNIPLIVGGGLREEADIIGAVNSGADMVVIGTALEKTPARIVSLYESFTAHAAI